jgi:hypothetical protein
MVSSCYCVVCAVRLQFKILWQGYIKNKKYWRFHRPVHRRNITRRYFTESWKIFTRLCHNHRRDITCRYFTESWKTFMGLCHNHRRSNRRLYRCKLPTESLTNYAHLEAHACQTRVRRHTYQRIEKFGGIFELFWCAYKLISDGITDRI